MQKTSSIFCNQGEKFFSLVLFLFLLGECLCQGHIFPESYFKTEKILSLEVDCTDYPFYNSERITVINDSIALSTTFMSIHKNHIRLNQINLFNSTSPLVSITLNIPKIGKRYVNNNIHDILYHNDTLYILTAGLLWVFDKNYKFLKQLKISRKWDTLDVMSTGQLLLSYYYNYHPNTSKKDFEIALYSKEGKEEKIIAPNPDQINFGYINRHHLVTTDGYNIIRGSLSNPKLYLYDAGLEIKDSLNLEIPYAQYLGPVLDSSLLSLELFQNQFKDLKLTKFHDLKWCGGNKYLLGYYLSYNCYGYSVILIENNKLVQTENIIQDAGQFWDFDIPGNENHTFTNEDISFINQMESGRFFKNKFYSIQFGTYSSPEGKTWRDYYDMKQSVSPEGKCYMYLVVSELTIP